MKKVTGIGGIFFKCDDPDKMKDWYRDHLGLDTNAYGVTFESRDIDNPEKKNALQWSTFPADTKYFEPSSKEFMINYRVENIVDLVEALESEGVQVLDEVATYEYGSFVHILDAEGNKIELWEPKDGYEF